MARSAGLRRGLAVIGAVAVAASCGAGQASDSGEISGATSTRSPRLQFARLYPLTVHGSGFAGRERVRVTLSGSRRGTKTVVADRRGRFTVRFAVRVPPCGSALARAVGNAGSRASGELPRPDCVEP